MAINRRKRSAKTRKGFVVAVLADGIHTTGKRRRKSQAPAVRALTRKPPRRATLEQARASASRKT